MRVGIAQAIVFAVAVKAVQGRVAAGRHWAMHDKHADGHRHLPIGDQMVENFRCVEL